MADDPGKESLDSNTTDQPDPTKDAIPAVDPETIPPIQQTENMEVHKHPHHVTHKKKWPEYLLEFFMLFLAVFLGFVAENIRENTVEHDRAKVFARLLIDDLHADITELNKAAKVLSKIIIAGDSLAQLLNTSEIKKVPGGKLYYYEYWSGWRWSIISRDATLQQLKNSGALRYLGDTSIIRKILNYEESIHLIYMLQNKYEPEKAENWNLVQRVFDQSYFNTLDSIAPRDSTTIYFEMNNEKLSRFLNSDIQLYAYEKDLMHELKNWAYNSSRNYKVIIHDISTAKEKALIAIEALKKEYHLE